jgi:hypothetical protein
VAGQTQIIWQDPSNQGWKVQTPYTFFLKHRPQTGVINLQIYEGSVKIGEKIVLFTALRPIFLLSQTLIPHIVQTFEVISEFISQKFLLLI